LERQGIPAAFAGGFSFLENGKQVGRNTENMKKQKKYNYGDLWGIKCRKISKIAQYVGDCINKS